MTAAKKKEEEEPLYPTLVVVMKENSIEVDFPNGWEPFGNRALERISRAIRRQRFINKKAALREGNTKTTVEEQK